MKRNVIKINIKPVFFITSITLFLFFVLFFKLNIVNADVTVNFGVNNLSPWIQTKDSDIRIESPDSIISSGVPIGSIFSNPLPGSISDSPAQFCGTADYSNAFVSLQGAGGTPGIIFSGTNDYSFGAGLASITTTNPPYGWVVGGSFANDYNSQLTRKTSYDFILSKATQGGLTPIDLTADMSSGVPVNHCGIGLTDCSLDSSILEHGLYIAKDDLRLTTDSGSYTFGNGQNYVILVNGNLTISTKILVPIGSTAIFIVKGDIIIDPVVGSDVITSVSPDIEGMYSADNDFIIEGISNCGASPSIPDKRLNLAGNIVTGAGGTGGAFINRRDLCEGDATCPVFFVSGRPDFILNLPTLIRYTNYTWQEVSP
jgi:hypothetical protein